MSANSIQPEAPLLKMAIFHNILWSKYKGSVFSALHEQTRDSNTQVSFTQIAATDVNRMGLNGVDLGYHRYPYELIFEGAYSQVPRFKRCMALMRRAWKTDADIVVMPGYEMPEYWAMLLVLMLRGKCRAVFCDSTARDQAPNKWKAIAKRFFFSKCHGFFCYGQRSKEYLQSLGVPEKKIYHRCQAAALPHGYSEASARANRMANARLRLDAPVLLYVGRLSHEKGLDTLLDAFDQVARVRPTVTLRLIGSGPLLDWLKARIAELGLQERVELLGGMPADQLSSQYERATALVLPSTSEPWGLVVNEALSYGCPVVVSDACGCVPELVTSDTGLVFATGDTRALIGALNHVVASAQDYREDDCINHIKRYSPSRAALQIRVGAGDIWKRFAHA